MIPRPFRNRVHSRSDEIQTIFAVPIVAMGETGFVLLKRFRISEVIVQNTFCIVSSIKGFDQIVTGSISWFSQFWQIVIPAQKLRQPSKWSVDFLSSENSRWLTSNDNPYGSRCGAIEGRAIECYRAWILTAVKTYYHRALWSIIQWFQDP